MPTGTKELQLIKDTKAHVTNTLAALEKNDLAGARKAWAMYNPIWNGMEVYVSARSPANYNDIEMNWELKIDKALEAPTATAEEILPMLKGQLATWEQAEKLAATGPAISPLFDTVADIRLQRQPLRKAMSQVNKGDIAGGKISFAEFVRTWPTVGPLFKTRSWAAEGETDAAIKAASAAFSKASATDAELKPLLATILNRHTFGLNLFNAAARKADLSRKAAAQEDITAAGALRAAQGQLKTSLSAWDAGKYGDAASAGNKAASDLFNAALVALKAKALDVNLKKALDDYASLAGAAGDKAKAASANKAAIEACEIAVEGLIGQFWEDQKLQAAVMAAAPN